MTVQGTTLTATSGEERLGGLAVAGLLLVPVLVGVLLAWGLSAPVQHLDRVTAAVVNDDAPVTLDGRTVPLGRQLAAGLIGGQAGTGAPDDPGSDATTKPESTGPNFTWVLTNDDDAAAGLADGTYAAVVTIPSSFSAEGTSISGPAPLAVRASVTVETTPATAFLDPALTDVVVQTAVRTLNTQLTERYLKNVYDGFNQINSSIGQAADGADQLASGASSLSSGADQLASGAEQLSEGLDSLDSGAAELSSGLDRLAASTRSLPGQTAELARGSAQVAAATDAEARALSSATDRVAGVVATICRDPGRLCDRATAALAQLQAASSDVDRLAAGADEVAAGNRQLAQGMPSLVSGIDQSASGATKLAAGADSSASGGASVASGAADVASGADQVDSGAAQLSSGLSEAVDEIPTYTDDDITTLSAVVAQPTEAKFDLPPTGTQSVPLFAVVALWVGGMAAALGHRAVARSRLLTASSTPALTWGSAWPVLALGAAGGLLTSLPLLPFMDVGTVSTLGFAVACVAVGAAFAVVNHGLAALFGGAGRILAVVIATVALVVGTASTAPTAIESFAAFAPTGPGHTLLLAAIGVGSGWGAVVALGIWVAAGVVFALAGTSRRRGARALES